MALTGARVIVTAGGTREPIDPVRYLGNRSSGKMGNALAQAAAARGARVTLITTVAPPDDDGIAVIEVESAAEMQAEVERAMDDADLLLMAAAVADYRPRVAATSKLKKHSDDWQLTLVPTNDILTSLRAHRSRASVFVVGFAAETDDLVDNARRKLHDKGLDLIVLNDVSRSEIGMGADDNEVSVIDAHGVVAHHERASKRRIADQILDIVAERLHR